MSHGHDGVVEGTLKSFHRAETQKLEELLATQNQLKRFIERCFCCGLLPLKQMTAGWDLFSKLQNRIDELIESVRPAALHIELH